MSRLNSGQKRSLGKRSPLSKRPKLDFSKEIVESSSNSSRKSSNGYYRENSPNRTPDKTLKKIIPCSEWDEEFSGDMLEKVCLIADLSQAMVNGDPPSLKHLEPVDEVSLEPINNCSASDEFERLRIENEKLKENFKTKEGEIQILRSQLEQFKNAKQTEALNNLRAYEEMQQKCQEKILNSEKEFESMKSMLQFRDLEVKSLTERCKQLESSTSKIKLVEPEAMHVDYRKSMFNLSQAPASSQKPRVSNIENQILREGTNIDVEFKFYDKEVHEGKDLADLICPELFRFIEEPSIVPLYTFRSENNRHMSRLDFDKREKYKWSGLPKQNFFIKDTYNLVTNLFLFENFRESQAETVIEDVLETCVSILTYQQDVFNFIETLQISQSEYDEADQTLLENEEEVNFVSVKILVNGEKIRREECGIEARRTLALILTLMQSSQFVLDLVSSKTEFLTILKTLVASIGHLRRPLRYTGVLAAVTLILKEILRKQELSQDSLTLLSEITEEVIFSRPKLDVLRELIVALQVGRHHPSFMSHLCRKCCVKSCALYMDSKLQQAMFFTKEACPLKVLCKQIMGLACLPSSKKLRCDLTTCVIRWLQFSMDTDKNQIVKWLPSMDSEGRCCDVIECLVYLLNLCIRDYKELPKPELASAIGNGALLVRRVLKLDQRLLHDNVHNLRFAVELMTLGLSAKVPPTQAEAIKWITELLESDLKSHEACGKSNISGPTEEEIINALKVSGEIGIL